MLPVFAADKANHAVYGSAICAVVASLSLMLPMPAAFAPLAGLAASAALGAIKERLDKTGGTYDRLDIVATAAGGALVSLPMLLAALA